MENSENTLQLVIASKNVHKIREIKSILSQYKNLDIFSLLDFPNYIPLEEDKETFKGNAIQKATHAAQALKYWVIADDSGLVVPALKGEPGIYSARYAGINASDKDNRIKLLDKMKHLLDNDRNAYFECCTALASPDGLRKCACGTVEGQISLNEKGGGGFGYDPLFTKHEYGKTFAELTEETKNRVSHRRKALDKIIIDIESILGE
jgi:XTP/dITP diphosphohydrolase